VLSRFAAKTKGTILRVRGGKVENKFANVCGKQRVNYKVTFERKFDLAKKYKNYSILFY
jgi:hypothetical protein